MKDFEIEISLIQLERSKFGLEQVRNFWSGLDEDEKREIQPMMHCITTAINEITIAIAAVKANEKIKIK